jgi:hypothetical protein
MTGSEELLRRFGLWRCRVLRWHKAPRYVSFDGASFGGECPRCGASVLQDSQGNWFESGISRRNRARAQLNDSPGGRGNE